MANASEGLYVRRNMGVRYVPTRVMLTGGGGYTTHEVEGKEGSLSSV